MTNGDRACKIFEKVKIDLVEPDLDFLDLDNFGAIRSRHLRAHNENLSTNLVRKTSCKVIERAEKFQIRDTKL